MADEKKNRLERTDKVQSEAQRDRAEARQSADENRDRDGENDVVVREVPQKDTRGAVTANDPGPVQATGVITDDGSLSQGQIINEPPAGLGPGGSTIPPQGRSAEGQEYVTPGEELDLPLGFSVERNHRERKEAILKALKDAGLSGADAIDHLAGKLATAQMLIAPRAVENGGWLRFNQEDARRANKVVDIPATVTGEGARVAVEQDMLAAVMPVFNRAERLGR